MINQFSFDINLYSVLGPKRIDLVFKLWEIAILNRSIMILADSPAVCR